MIKKKEVKFNVNETAKLLGIHRTTLYRWIRCGLVRARVVRFGIRKTYEIDKATILALNDYLSRKRRETYRLEALRKPVHFFS